MLKFHVERLTEIFLQRVYTEYGSLKLREINAKITQSRKVLNYLETVGANFYRPTSKGILSVLNNIPYFMFSKGETLCVGGLLILQLWNVEFNQDFPILTDEEVTAVCANLILECYKIKLQKADSLFSRFFTEIREIDNQSENGLPNHFDFPDHFNLDDDVGFDYGERLD